MFQKEAFIQECQGALRESDARAAMREVMARAVAEPQHLLRELGEPTRGGVDTLHRSPTLTVLRIVWGPEMTTFPHDHRMWAVIGIYGGREENSFYRRDGETLVRHGSKCLDAGDAVVLGESVIHAVHNPLAQLTAALHVYHGDFFDTPRSEWDPDTLCEQPFDINRTLQAFEAANERLREA